ncbi:MAG TPA: HAMP domain-containing sensor histidine kinase, partial [Bacteroidales bacterium]|nr:HAMP domain-containing sensor histidine kinase [Bacteroidales bacterium]
QHIDITRQKMTEDTLIENEKTLQKLNADKDRFISIIGHDLVGPFNPILGLLHLLSENIRSYDVEKAEKMLKSLHNSALSVYNLLQETLDWVNAQSGKLPYQPQHMDFEEICLDIIDVLTPSLTRKNISIDYNGGDDASLFGDKNMIKTVVRNLISNAIKFTHEGGKIILTIEKDANQTTISVCDNGVGVDPKDHAKLFDDSLVFSTNGTNHEKGSGLGLIICKEFVKKHGGQIWVESEPGMGSCFRFTVPHKN